MTCNDVRTTVQLYVVGGPIGIERLVEALEHARGCDTCLRWPPLRDLLSRAEPTAQRDHDSVEDRARRKELAAEAAQAIANLGGARRVLKDLWPGTRRERRALLDVLAPRDLRLATRVAISTEDAGTAELLAHEGRVRLTIDDRDPDAGKLTLDGLDQRPAQVLAWSPSKPSVPPALLEEAAFLDIASEPTGWRVVIRATSNEMSVIRAGVAGGDLIVTPVPVTGGASLVARAPEVADAETLSRLELSRAVDAAAARALNTDAESGGLRRPVERNAPLDEPRPTPASIDIALTDGTLRIDPLDPVDPPGPPELSDALRSLALAELRLKGHPESLWVIDAALAAIDLADRLALDRDADQPIVTLAEQRAGAAVKQLLTIPVVVLVRGGDVLRDALREANQALRSWFGDSPESDALAEWQAGWPVDLAIESSADVTIGELVLLGGDVRRVPVAAAIVAAGLVEPGTQLQLTPSTSQPEALDASLPLRGAVAYALGMAQTAWDRARSAGAQPADAIADDRARLVLRAMIRTRLDQRAWDSEGPELPTVVARVFDSRTERLLHESPLLAEDDGVLRGTIPELDGTGVRVDLLSALPPTPRSVAAGALAGTSDQWRPAAEELLVLAPRFADAEARAALLRVAELLAADETVGSPALRAEIHDQLRRVQQDPAPRLRLRTVALEVLEGVRAARRPAEADVLGALDPRVFGDLDIATQRDRLNKHSERVAEFDELDSRLL